MSKFNALTAEAASRRLREFLADPNANVTPEELMALQTAQGQYTHRLIDESPSYREGLRALGRSFTLSEPTHGRDYSHLRTGPRGPTGDGQPYHPASVPMEKPAPFSHLVEE